MVIGVLRFVGLMNAAVWLGSAVFFTVGAGPAVFSQDMKDLLGANNYPYFSGAIAQVIMARYFHLQLVCGIVALLHALAEWLYLGRPPRKFGLGLLVGLIALGLVGGFWLQPKIKELHTAKYAVNIPSAVQAAKAKSLRVWHGATQTANLLVLAGLAVYLWRVAHPISTTRFVMPVKFQV
jgi:hypothetical protein